MLLFSKYAEFWAPISTIPFFSSSIIFLVLVCCFFSQSNSIWGHIDLRSVDRREQKLWAHLQ